MEYTAYFFRVNRNFSEVTEQVNFTLPEQATIDNIWDAAKSAMMAEYGHRQVDCWNCRRG